LYQGLMVKGCFHSLFPYQYTRTICWLL